MRPSAILQCDQGSTCFNHIFIPCSSPENTTHSTGGNKTKLCFNHAGRGAILYLTSATAAQVRCQGGSTLRTQMWVCKGKDHGNLRLDTEMPPISERGGDGPRCRAPARRHRGLSAALPRDANKPRKFREEQQHHAREASSSLRASIGSARCNQADRSYPTGQTGVARTVGRADARGNVPARRCGRGSGRSGGASPHGRRTARPCHARTG